MLCTIVKKANPAFSKKTGFAKSFNGYIVFYMLNNKHFMLARLLCYFCIAFNK
jgi:hypothetical protein